MKKIRLALLSMVVGMVVFATSAAFAAGYPFAVIDGSTGFMTVIVGKFSTQFTQQEAQDLTASVVSLVQGTLGSTSDTYMYTPNNLAAMGITDADALKSMIKSSYVSSGFDLYAFIDIKKVSQYAAGFGQNIRIDLYIADMAAELGISADYLYAVSVETPLMYTALLSEL